MKRGKGGKAPQTDWRGEQERFTVALPKIRGKLTWVFRKLPPWVDREEAIQEGIALAWQGWRAAVLRGKDPATFAHSLGEFSARRAVEGRRIAGSNGCNIYGGDSSSSSRRSPLPLGRGQGGQLAQQALTYLSDDRLTPIPDQAAFRVDFRQWAEGLSHRQKTQANLSLEGHRTGEIAARLGTTANVVCNTRRRLWQSWQRFQDEPTD